MPRASRVAAVAMAVRPECILPFHSFDASEGLSRPACPISSERIAFCRRLLEGSADRHDFADRFHLRRQLRLSTPGKFLEREARDLRDDVVDRRLEARGRLARDVVANLVERVADRELGRDLGDRETRSPSRPEPRSATRGVHLDDDERAVFGIDGELDVRSARVDPDPDDRHAIAASRITWYSRPSGVCAGATVIESPGVHAHRVEVLDRTDDHDVVGASRITSSSYSFQPSTLCSTRHWWRGDWIAAPTRRVELLGHSKRCCPPVPPEREARPDDRREPYPLQDPSRVVE